MTAPWMPPLPEPDVIVHYTADQMRQAQADAARAALERAAQVARDRLTGVGAAGAILDLAGEITL